MRIGNRLVAVVVVVASLVAPALPGDAVDKGPITFSGDVTLPVFPCTPNCGATGTPNEQAPLVFTSDIAQGVGSRIGVGAAAAHVSTITARVAFAEPPCVAGEAVTGMATGTATLGGTNLVGNLLPLAVPFSWQRVGLVAVITSHPSLGPTAAIVGAALFIPTGGAPNCTGGPLTATVVGKAYVCFVTPEGVVCAYARDDD